MHPIRVLALVFFTAMSAAGVQAAELIMFTRAGCPWCAAWDREIGPIYPSTDVGQRTPLQRIDVAEQRRVPGLKNPVRFTPTFVLIDAGREVGRIEGYPGEDFFWARLEKLTDKLTQKPGGNHVSVPLGEKP